MVNAVSRESAGERDAALSSSSSSSSFLLSLFAARPRNVLCIKSKLNVGSGRLSEC